MIFPHAKAFNKKMRAQLIKAWKKEKTWERFFNTFNH